MHLQEVGGVDYTQATFKAYKIYLEAQGVQNIPCRDAMTHYFWLARKLGLIVFDHAEPAAYWNAQVNYPRITVRYQPEARPRAPSPRHYYRIVDSQDPRWSRLEASYRASIGLPTTPAFPRVPYIPLLALPPAPPVEEVIEVPAAPAAAGKPAKKARSKARPGVKPTPAETAADAAKPFEDRLALLSQALDQFLRVYQVNSALGNVQVVRTIEEELLNISGDLLTAIKGKKGAVRDSLNGISGILQQTINDIALLRTSLSDYQSATTPAVKARAQTGIESAVRVLKEDLTGEVPEE